jgi:hypothetical protein
VQISARLDKLDIAGIQWKYYLCFIQYNVIKHQFKKQLKMSYSNLLFFWTNFSEILYRMTWNVRAILSRDKSNLLFLEHSWISGLRSPNEARGSTEFPLNSNWRARVYPAWGFWLSLCFQCRPRSSSTSFCAIWSWCTLFAIQSVYILKFSLKKMNGFAQPERWTSPFKIFSMEIVIYFCFMSYLVRKLLKLIFLFRILFK